MVRSRSFYPPLPRRTCVSRTFWPRPDPNLNAGLPQKPHTSAPTGFMPARMAAAAYPQDVQGEATSLYARSACGAFLPDPRLRSIHKYFLYNSRPVNLDGLMQLLTPDVIVDYPSGRFIGIDSYMSHQVCAPLCSRPRTSASFFAVCRLARPACCAAAARHLL
jgi:hypothetical protein